MAMGGGRGVRYENPGDACTLSSFSWASATRAVATRNPYIGYDLIRIPVPRAGSNPVHGGQHFIDEGYKYAERANRDVRRAAWVLIIAIIALGVAFHFGL
jgi:hypothetical protein